MSKKILAFGASSSKNSINKRFATYTAQQIQDAEITVLDLNDFEMPIYSIDKEKENGFPELAIKFKEHIDSTDGIIISFAEHNGAYSAAFKNIFDWISRVDRDTWGSKPMLLLATSPGKRGGRTVLDIAVNKFKFMNPNTILSFSLPSFHENFSEENGVSEESLQTDYIAILKKFTDSVFDQSSS